MLKLTTAAYIVTVDCSNSTNIILGLLPCQHQTHSTHVHATFASMNRAFLGYFQVAITSQFDHPTRPRRIRGPPWPAEVQKRRTTSRQRYSSQTPTWPRMLTFTKESQLGYMHIIMVTRTIKDKSHMHIYKYIYMIYYEQKTV